MNERVRAFVLSVVVAAGAFGLALYFVAPDVGGETIRAVWVLSVLTILAQLLAHQLPTGAVGSISFIPNLALIILAPSWLTVAAIFVSSLFTGAAAGRAYIKVLFNAAQFALSASLASMAYRALGGVALWTTITNTSPLQEVAQFGTVLLVSLIFMGANGLAVSGVMALSSDKRLLAVWRSNVRSSIAYDLLASPAVYVLVWLYLRFGAKGAVGFAVPLLVVRQLYKTNSQLEQVNQDLLELMVKAIEARDPYTSGHSRRVGHYARVIARAVGLNGEQLERIEIAALLHDVGKIHEIYAPILRKPEKLSPAEWAVMQTHPIKSAELVGTVSHLKDIVAPVRHHHENWDGTGYPDGLLGDQIPLAARIVLFADTIDAMTTDRPYRKALSEPQVRSELIKFRGKQFDPEMCDKLLASPMFGLLFSPNQREKTPEEVTIPHKSSPDLVAIRP